MAHGSYIRNCLDNDEEISLEILFQDSKEDGIYAMGEILIQFIKALPEPLIPQQLVYNCFEVAKKRHSMNDTNSLDSEVLKVCHLYKV
jgi:hypothetical protein